MKLLLKKNKKLFLFLIYSLFSLNNVLQSSSYSQEQKIIKDLNLNTTDDENNSHLIELQNHSKNNSECLELLKLAIRLLIKYQESNYTEKQQIEAELTYKKKIKEIEIIKEKLESIKNSIFELNKILEILEENTAKFLLLNDFNTKTATLILNKLIIYINNILISKDLENINSEHVLEFIATTEKFYILFQSASEQKQNKYYELVSKLRFENKEKAQALINKIENIDLNLFNKLYKRFYNANGFEYTKTILNATLLLTAAFLFYLYFFTEENDSIRGLNWYRVKTKGKDGKYIQVIDPTTGNEIKDSYMTHPITWGDLFLKKFIGSIGKDKTNEHLITTFRYERTSLYDSPAKQKELDIKIAALEKEFSLGYKIKNAFFSTGIFSIAPHTINIYNWLYEKVNDPIEKISKEINSQKNILHQHALGKKNIEYIDPIFGSNVDKKMDCMIGREDLKAQARYIADYIINPERYKALKIEPSLGILLYGPPQTGKTFFAQILRSHINEELKKSGKAGSTIKFLNITEKIIQFFEKKYESFGLGGIDAMFYFARQNAPCVVFIDEIDMLKLQRDQSTTFLSALLTHMKGIDSESYDQKTVIVIAATNKPESLDYALLIEGRFGKIVPFYTPSYEDRKTFLEKEIKSRYLKINSDYINEIAKITEDCTYNQLSRIIMSAVGFAISEMRSVTIEDFEHALDQDIRKINHLSSIKLTEKEKTIISIYQAGTALSRELLETIQQVSKITISAVERTILPQYNSIIQSNKNNFNLDSLNKLNEQKDTYGKVFTSCIEPNKVLSDFEKTKECIVLSSGHAALQILTGDTYSGSYGKNDNDWIMNIIKSKTLGLNIAKITDEKITEIENLKKEYFETAIKLLTPYIEELKKLSLLIFQKLQINSIEWRKWVKENLKTKPNTESSAIIDSYKKRNFTLKDLSKNDKLQNNAIAVAA